MQEIDAYIKILNVYRKLLVGYRLGKLSGNDVLRLYIDYLKEYIKLGTNKPTYLGDINNYRGCNCYCYAIGMNCPSVFSLIYDDIEIEDLIHQAGFLSLRGYTRNKEEIIKNIYDGFDVLGIEAYDSSVDEEIKHNGYKIALYIANYDFHMARENVDGSWSEKLGYSDRIIKIKNPYDSRVGCDRSSTTKDYKLDRVIEIVKPTIKKKVYLI